MVGRAVAVEEFTGFVGQSEWYFFGLGNKGKAGAYPKCWICSYVGDLESLKFCRRLVGNLYHVPSSLHHPEISESRRRRRDTSRGSKTSVGVGAGGMIERAYRN